jgi:hypothetical protein
MYYPPFGVVRTLVGRQANSSSTLAVNEGEEEFFGTPSLVVGLTITPIGGVITAR